MTKSVKQRAVHLSLASALLAAMSSRLIGCATGGTALGETTSGGPAREAGTPGGNDTSGGPAREAGTPGGNDTSGGPAREAGTPGGNAGGDYTSGVAGCCVEHHVTYRITVDPIALPGGCPAVVLAFEENTSSACIADCMMSGIVPGFEVLEKAITPGVSDTVGVPVSYAEPEPPPLLDVQAYCDANRNGRIDTGEACFAFLSLFVGDHENVALTEGECPGRK
jgi:hypothetical protein